MDDGPHAITTANSMDQDQKSDHDARSRGGDSDSQKRASSDENRQPSESAVERGPRKKSVGFMTIFLGLSWLDRLLPLLVITAMILGVVLGEFVPNIKEHLIEQATLLSVPAPLATGLIVMMWPILTKVQYELLPTLVRSRKLWTQIFTSLFINWIIGPFLMLALAWATLPDLPEYRDGVILVGAARCIAMVMIWVSIARGDCNICACIVVVNAVLQIVGYAPLCLLLINVISDGDNLSLQYGKTALSVLIYLGIPLVSGVVTRFVALGILGRRRFENVFLPYFGPLSLAALLYVIIVIFASQARQILDNLGPVFRTVVPLVLYFSLMWTLTFVVVWRLSLRGTPTRARIAAAQDARISHAAKSSHSANEKRPDDLEAVDMSGSMPPPNERDDAHRAEDSQELWGYEMAVVQSFTGASNNFELAIAIAVAAYGADSQATLGATIGPLVEVPVLLILSYVALWLGQRLQWQKFETIKQDGKETEKQKEANVSALA